MPPNCSPLRGAGDGYYPVTRTVRATGAWAPSQALGGTKLGPTPPSAARERLGERLSHLAYARPRRAAPLRFHDAYAMPPSARLLERKKELDAKVEDARRNLALLLKERADLEKHLSKGFEVEDKLEAAAHC